MIGADAISKHIFLPPSTLAYLSSLSIIEDNSVKKVRQSNAADVFMGSPESAYEPSFPQVRGHQYCKNFLALKGLVQLQPLVGILLQNG